MPRLRVHYACEQCGHTSTAEYFDYAYHRTEAVRAPCGGCRFMTEHTPQRADRTEEHDWRPASADINGAGDDRPRLETWRKFYQHGFTCWKCSRCGVVQQSMEVPDPCDCSN